jgi:hypothetical protein
MPGCDVTLPVSDAPGPFGVFGNFDSLSMVFDREMNGKRVLAQDLAGEEAIDISHSVQIRGNIVHIPGTLIRKVGLHNATPGDLSKPGLVLAFS